MRRTLSVALLLAIVAALACHGAVRFPADETFDSCHDPRIERAPRLTISEPGNISIRLSTHEDRVESVAEATALFAQASLSSGFVATDPNVAVDHAPIDAFIRETDFAHDELVFERETVVGSDGYAGTISHYGKTAIVAHQCGASGGAAPPTGNWIAVYRIPRGNVLTTAGCESCGEPVPCCPP